MNIYEGHSVTVFSTHVANESSVAKDSISGHSIICALVPSLKWKDCFLDFLSYKTNAFSKVTTQSHLIAVLPRTVLQKPMV